MRALRLVSLVAVFLSLVRCATVARTDAEANLPAQLNVPAGNHRAFADGAQGVQIYECKAADSGFTWVLQGPDANLSSADGAAAGKHFAGPTWQAADGSSVTAAKLAAAVVDATAIPWLLLQANAHTGNGVMSPVTFIQRRDTAGGLAPAGGCDAASVGQVARVPYTAQYVFFTPAPT